MKYLFGVSIKVKLYIRGTLKASIVETSSAGEPSD